MTADPRCPECDAAVGSQAQGCIHCGARFDEPAAGSGTDWGADTKRTETSTDREPPAAGRDRAGDRLDRLLEPDPDGIVDNALTAVLGLVAGVCCGAAALLVFGTVGGGLAGVVAALAAFVGVTWWTARRASVFGAVRAACYALAVALVALPVVALTDAAKGGTLGGQVLLFLVGELVFGAVAAALAGIGYSVGRRRPDPGDGESADAVGSSLRRE